MTQIPGCLDSRLGYERITVTGDIIQPVILAKASQEELERQNEKKRKKEDSRIWWQWISGNEPRKRRTLGKLSR